MRIVLRLPRHRNPLALFVGLSVTVHVVAALVLLVAPFGHRRGRIADASMVVELAGPMPGPPATSSAPASGSVSPPRAEPPAPAPPPKETKEPKASIVEPPDRVKDVKEKKEKKKEAPRNDAEPAPALPAPPPRESPAPPGTGSPAPQPGAPGGLVPGGTGGISSLQTGGSELGWYWASVAAAIRSRWARPILEGSAGTLQVTITFEVRRDGTVTNLTVETGSGVSTLDRSALRAVTDASPLPPIPASWKEPTLQARYLFELTPDE